MKSLMSTQPSQACMKIAANNKKYTKQLAT